MTMVTFLRKIMTMVTFLVLERKATIADNAIGTLEELCTNVSPHICNDISYVSPKGILLNHPDSCSITSYASAIKNGELSAEILELITINGPVIILLGLTLSEEDAVIRDQVGNIDFGALTAAAVVKAMEKKKDCAFLLTSDCTDYNNSFVEAMLSKFPSINPARFSHTVFFRSQGGYDEAVMWARVKELLDYLSTVVAK